MDAQPPTARPTARATHGDAKMRVMDGEFLRGSRGMFVCTTTPHSVDTSTILPAMKRRLAITPYPRGWFMVARSEELAPKAVLRLHYFDQDLVLFRDEEGAAHLVDPHCSHMGAHLGHGGVVDGTCLRCPFHGWRYDGAGQCAEIPYAKKIPPGARIYSWPLKEACGFIFAWFHEDREAPSWTLPDVPDHHLDGWTDWKETRWTIRACIQDISENDVDSAHLPVLHQFTDRVPTGTHESDGPGNRYHARADLDRLLDNAVAWITDSGCSRVRYDRD